MYQQTIKHPNGNLINCWYVFDVYNKTIKHTNDNLINCCYVPTDDKTYE